MNTNTVDQRLEAMLGEIDRQLADIGEGEPPLTDLIAESFRGRRRGLVALSWAGSLLFTVAAGVCVYQFFHAAGERAMLAWGFGFVWAMLAVAMLKMWYFMEVNRNRVVREVKRVELQLARLAERIDRPTPSPPG